MTNRIVSSLEKNAMQFLERDDAKSASIVLSKLLEVAVQLGDQRFLAHALNLKALTLVKLGEYAHAKRLRKKERKIYENLKDYKALRRWCCNQALIAHHESDESEANILYDELESLGTKDSVFSDVVHLYTIQASLVGEQCSYISAIKIMQRLERLCRRMDDFSGLAVSLVNQAGFLIPLAGKNTKIEALNLYDEAYKIAHEHKINDLLQHIPNLRKEVEQILDSY